MAKTNTNVYKGKIKKNLGEYQNRYQTLNLSTTAYTAGHFIRSSAEVQF